MNYGAEPADQVVRYSLEGMEYSLKITGNVAKHVAIFIAAALKDQKKTRGKTRLTRMLKEQRPMKFFTVPGDRLKEFAKEAKARGILYMPQKATMALAFVMMMNYLAILLYPFIIDFLQNLFHTQSQEFPFVFNLLITIVTFFWAYLRRDTFLFNDQLK